MVNWLLHFELQKYIYNSNRLYIYCEELKRRKTLCSLYTLHCHNRLDTWIYVEQIWHEKALLIHHY